MHELNFRQFVENYTFDDLEVANMYFHNHQLPVREISQRTGKSIGEIYRILRRYGQPNRQYSNHENVLALADSGFPIPSIADLTGYTIRHVRNILKR